MLKTKINTIVSAVSVVLLVFACGFSRAEMNADWERFEANPSLPLNGQHSQKIDAYHYVFVGGYFNEAVRGDYFDLNVKTIRELGATAVSRIFPSSFRSAESNTQVLKAELDRLYRTGDQRPIILIGHSKGGLESLATVIKFPELVEQNVVTDVVLLQAPIGGNKLSDTAAIGHQIMARVSLMATAYSSLQTKEIKRIIGDRIAQLPKATRELLSSKVKYVISSKTVSEMGWGLRLASGLSRLEKMSVPYDGLVAQEDMWLPKFGRIIGDLTDVDHLEVVLGRKSFIADNVNQRSVIAFTKSLLVNVLKSQNPRQGEYHTLTANKSAVRSGLRLCRSTL